MDGIGTKFGAVSYVNVGAGDSGFKRAFYGRIDGGGGDVGRPSADEGGLGTGGLSVVEAELVPVVVVVVAVTEDGGGGGAIVRLRVRPSALAFLRASSTFVWSAVMSCASSAPSLSLP